MPAKKQSPARKLSASLRPPAKRASAKRAKPPGKPGKKPARPKNYCFGCGRDNPSGLHLKMKIDPALGEARGAFRASGRLRGSRYHLHGGIIATLLDEAMGNLNRLEAIIAPTAELHIEYLRPVAISSKISIAARPERIEGRNHWREGTITDAEGRLLVRARGRFVKIGERSPKHP